MIIFHVGAVGTNGGVYDDSSLLDFLALADRARRGPMSVLAISVVLLVVVVSSSDSVSSELDSSSELDVSSSSSSSCVGSFAAVAVTALLPRNNHITGSKLYVSLKSGSYTQNFKMHQ